MMRTCPKCGDYYADESLAFCRADGMPLRSVDPKSESWNKGTRKVAQKENALRTKKQRLKWRRVLSVMTMLIVTMVVYGMAARRYVYLVPLASPSPSPTPSPSPSPTPSPSPSPTPSPSPPLPDCSEDKGQEEAAIKKSIAAVWQPVIDAERNKIIGDRNPAGLPTAVPTMDPIRHEIRFKACTASVTVTYSWQVTINGTKSIIPRPPKRFACTKAKGRWLCRLSLN